MFKTVLKYVLRVSHTIAEAPLIFMEYVIAEWVSGSTSEAISRLPIGLRHLVNISYLTFLALGTVVGFLFCLPAIFVHSKIEKLQRRYDPDYFLNHL